MSAKMLKRKCRWCGQVYKVPRDSGKTYGCPSCAPKLVPDAKAQR